MALDPVCGMTVDPARAAGQFDYEGTTYFFCSKGCLAKFAADPQKYLAGAHEPMAHAPSPVIQLRGLKPSAHAAPAAEHRAPSTQHAPASAHPPPAEYTCPMHPEIVRSRPGACPLCGMALEPRIPDLSDAPNPELADMTRRFWIGVALGAPVFLVSMAD